MHSLDLTKKVSAWLPTQKPFEKYEIAFLCSRLNTFSSSYVLTRKTTRWCIMFYVNVNKNCEASVIVIYLIFGLENFQRISKKNEKIHSSIITSKGAYDKNFSSNSHIKQYTQILSVRSRLQHEKTKRNCNTYAIKTNLLPME